MYYEIVFLQGYEADEALDILNNIGISECLEYLKQWDYGGESENIMTMRESEPFGTDDKLIKREKYIIAYNNNLNYIGLTRNT